MAGLEIVVRPVIFPDIRPRPRPALPPEDDPTKGFAVIQGNPAGSTSSSLSVSINSSHARPVENERRVDEARVYQQDDDGTINKDNFVDVEVANRITMEEPVPVSDKFAYLGVIPTIERKHFYEPVEEKENIEIMKRDIIKTGSSEADAT